MASNSARGAAAKAKTRKWLAAQGFDVGDLEAVKWMHTPGGRIPQKRDQFGADLLAVSHLCIVFVQVKSGLAAVGGNFPDARRTFAAYRFPTTTKFPDESKVQLWVVGWPPRARQPRVVNVTDTPHDKAACDARLAADMAKAEARRAGAKARHLAKAVDTDLF